MHPADLPGPLVFVDDLDAPVLSDEDNHHLRRVLRLRPGSPVTLGDGAGRWRSAALGDPVEVTGPILSTSRPEPAVSVGFALVKGDKPELIVQKLTELGVDAILPFRAERSVVRWDQDKAAKAVNRLRAVARNASMQCHRPWLPIVADVVDFAAISATPGAARADRGGSAPSLRFPVWLVGPEGGWSEGERKGDIPTVSLGGNVLRAETAAVTAGVLLTAMREFGSVSGGGFTEGG